MLYEMPPPETVLHAVSIFHPLPVPVRPSVGVGEHAERHKSTPRHADGSSRGMPPPHVASSTFTTAVVYLIPKYYLHVFAKVHASYT